MLSDFTMIVGGLGKLVQPEVQENRKKCEEYIKAWKMSTEDLKNFIVSHYVIRNSQITSANKQNQDKYTLKALHGLIQSHLTVKSLTRQQRREIIKEIEDLDIKYIRENL